MTRAVPAARSSPLATMRRRRIAYLSYRRLYPLWRALYAAHPDIALMPAQGAVADALAVRDLDLRLYRRVIEIRDGMLLLSPYVSPQVTAQARTEAERAGIPGPEISAYVDAAVLVVALQDIAQPEDTKAQPPGGTTAPPAGATAQAGGDEVGHGGTTLCAEIAYLVRVARHFRRLRAAVRFKR